MNFINDALKKKNYILKFQLTEEVIVKEMVSIKTVQINITLETKSGPDKSLSIDCLYWMKTVNIG